MARSDWQTAVALLRLATQLAEAMQAGLATRGFEGVRPAYGYAFVRISHGGATTVAVAEHLGVTKQAASQIVEHLVDAGWVTRRPDPLDGRARLLKLTARGRACTAAAEEVAAATVEGWRAQIEPATFAALEEALAALATPGSLRPPW